jgi:hypothetical protein
MRILENVRDLLREPKKKCERAIRDLDRWLAPRSEFRRSLRRMTLTREK